MVTTAPAWARGWLLTSSVHPGHQHPPEWTTAHVTHACLTREQHQREQHNYPLSVHFSMTRTSIAGTLEAETAHEAAVLRIAAISTCIFMTMGSALAQGVGGLEQLNRSALAMALPGFQQTDQSLNQLLADGFELKSVSDGASGTLFALQRRSTVAICIVAGFSGTACVLSLEPAAAAQEAERRSRVR